MQVFVELDKTGKSHFTGQVGQLFRGLRSFERISCKKAFAFIRETHKEEFRYHAIQHRIAQVFQAFIAVFFTLVHE